MGIFRRMNRIIKSNVNELVDKMSDPAKEIDLLIDEMQKGLKETRKETVTAVASVKRGEQEVERLGTELERWQQRAEQAVRAGDDQLARQALGMRMDKAQELSRAKATLAEQRAHSEELKSALKQFEQRLEQIKARRGTLKQRARSAKDGGEPQPAGGKAFADFDRLEARIEAMAEMQELSESMDARDARVEADIRKLAREQGDPAIDDELAALKARMEDG